MRLWSLHPTYLDTKGLVAVWREGLLAQKVLQGKTYGYRFHPQLRRFQNSKKPKAMIANYLRGIFDEAFQRGYNFNSQKIASSCIKKKIAVTSDQLEYEFDHLLRKLWNRDRALYKNLKKVKQLRSHTIFFIKPGPVEDWEIV